MNFAFAGSQPPGWENTPSFRQGLPESSPQGCETVGWKRIYIKQLLMRRVTVHGFWICIRAAKPCKSAVLPICPAIPAGMTGLQHWCITLSGDRGNHINLFLFLT